MQYKYLLILRYSLINLVGLVFLFVLITQGYVSKAIKADITNMVIVILALFSVGFIYLSSVVDPDTNKRRQILKTAKKLEEVGKEITVFQFELDKKGKLNKNTINNKYVMLRSGNKDVINQADEETLNN